MKQVRIALIGYGYWGIKIFNALKTVNTALVRVVCDYNPLTTRGLLLEKRNIRIVDRAQNVIHDSNVDAVIIATPPKTHYQLAAAFLRSGKHVFVEKPMTLSSNEAKKLQDLVQAKKLIFQVDHTYIFSDEIQYIKKILQRKKLGQIICAESIRTGPGKYQNDCNVLWDLGVHDISILYYLFGKPKKIKAQGYHYLTKKNYDAANVELLFNCGINTNIYVSWLSPAKVRRFTIIGTKGALIYDDSPIPKVTLYNGVIAQNTSFEDINSGLLNMSYHKQQPNIHINMPLNNSLKSFIYSINSGKQSLSDVNMGVEVVNIIEKANKSLLSGSKIVIYD